MIGKNSSKILRLPLYPLPWDYVCYRIVFDLLRTTALTGLFLSSAMEHISMSNITADIITLSHERVSYFLHSYFYGQSIQISGSARVPTGTGRLWLPVIGVAKSVDTRSREISCKPASNQRVIQQCCTSHHDRTRICTRCALLSDNSAILPVPPASNATCLKLILSRQTSRRLARRESRLIVNSSFSRCL